MSRANAPSLSENSMRPTVVIVGPPWPHSGTARLIANQVEYYRGKGYTTVFLCVPIHCSYTESYPEWEDIRQGMKEIGADRTYFAPINQRRFVREKYVAWVRHAFRGTALDWIAFTGASADLPKEAMDLIQNSKIAAVHINHVYTMGFALRLLRRIDGSGKRVPIIIETHDVQAHLLRERGEINPWTHRLDDLDKLLQSEVSLLDRAPVLIHCSMDDLDFFKTRLPHKRHVLALPTIDESFVSKVKSTSPGQERIDLLFIGQSTDPNLAAMKWLFEEVWPLIADRGYRLSIVGKVEMLVRTHLPEIYREYGAHFLGPVRDLAPYYADARCIVAPMVSGTGISIKTVEALALGKPFVGTSKAYRGMPVDRIVQHGLRPTDTPQAFADAITEALADESSAAESSRRAYGALFSKGAAFSSRDEALRIATEI